jgi:hypothetical protein
VGPKGVSTVLKCGMRLQNFCVPLGVQDRSQSSSDDDQGLLSHGIVRWGLRVWISVDF